MTSPVLGRLAPLLAFAALAVPAAATAQAAPDRWFVVPISSANDGGATTTAAGFVGAAEDGSRVLFSTSDALVPEDEDTALDVYERSGAQLTLVTTPAPGAQDAGGLSPQVRRASADARTVVFQSAESLSPDDTDDGAVDLYEHSGGLTRLVSKPDPSIEPGFEFPFISPIVDISPTGRWIAFATTQTLSPDDSDTSQDVYLYDRDSGVATLASGSGSDPVSLLRGAGDAGSRRLFMQTTGALISAEDADGQQDVYAYHSATGALSLETPGTAEAMAFGAISTDGSRLLYSTSEPVLPADTDAVRDVYEHAGGQTTLVSTAPGAPPAEQAADFQRASADGDYVFFSTAMSLVAADTDGGVDDIYRRASDGTVALVSTGPGETRTSFSAIFSGATPDGLHAFMYTTQDLTTDDHDGAFNDAFEWSAAGTTRISVGEQNDDAPEEGSFAGFSADVSRLFFQDTGQRTVEDTDASEDLYDRHDGHTSLVTPALEPCTLQPSPRCIPQWNGVSLDGRRVWIVSDERLHGDDTDGGATDVYESRLALPGSVDVAGAPIVYAPGDPAVAVDGALSVSDPYDDLFGATVRVATGFEAGADELAAPAAADLPDGITASVSAAHDTVTFSGRASDADYRAALRGVTYRNARATPTADPRTIELTVDNGGGAGAAAVRRVARPAPPPGEDDPPPPAGTETPAPPAAPAPLAPVAIGIRDTGAWVAHLRPQRMFRVPGLVFHCTARAAANCAAAVVVSRAGDEVAAGAVNVPPGETRGIKLRLRAAAARALRRGSGRVRLRAPVLYTLAGSEPDTLVKRFRLLAAAHRR